MIRTTRGCLLWKNCCSLPIFTGKRAANVPKQIFVHFSVVADKEEQSTTQERPESKDKSIFSKITEEELKESFGEIKYGFLRHIFQGGLPNTKNISQRDTALKDFFNSLPAFTPPEIIRVLKLLCETNNRPVASLKALCALLLTQENWKYTVKECADLLYCLSKLTYSDKEVITLVANQLLQHDDYHSPKLAGYMMYNLADLRFRNSQLLKQLLQYALSCNCSIRTSLHCLRSVSLLNYSSPDVDQLIQSMDRLRDVDFIQSTDYIDFVWSCVILNKENEISHEHIKQVLSEAFIKRVVAGGVNSAVHWKLMNINAAARLLEKYDGPLLNHQNTFKVLTLGVPNQQTPFLLSVLDVLSQVVPRNGHVRSLVNIGSGFHLDFEYIDNVAKTHGPKNPKLGIVLQNFKDICSDEVMSGMAAFKLRILQGSGYKTLVLRYSEYDFSAPLTEKINFVREKLNTAGVATKDMEKHDLFRKVSG